MITSSKLDALIATGQLKAYVFDTRNDTGKNPYRRLELTFPQGNKIVILPEGEVFGEERFGIY